MKCIQRLAAMVVLTGILVGCTSEITKPVGLDVALRGIEEGSAINYDHHRSDQGHKDPQQFSVSATV